MSVYIDVNGKRMIECNCCGKIAESNHGIVVNNSSNDTPPIGWNIELLKVPNGVGYYWKRQHFCSDCQRKA